MLPLVARKSLHLLMIIIKMINLQHSQSLRTAIGGMKE